MSRLTAAMTRRMLPIALAALVALAFSACGSKPATITQGESEASYVTLDNMQYQVQLSRQLNAADVSDRDILVGLDPLDRVLKKNEILFAVWVRVYNKSGATHRSADTFKIIDTRGREYEPIAFSTVNRFAYRPAPVADGARMPLPGSAADGSPTSGSLLVFKLPVDALDFRPLELSFAQSAAPKTESTIRLDV
jgi:hypothetical protein